MTERESDIFNTRGHMVIDYSYECAYYRSQMMATMMQSGSDKVMEHAAHIMSNLSKNPVLAPGMLRREALSPLILLLSLWIQEHVP